MITVKCYCCDEFQLRGKAETGYCNEYNLPTWKSVVKKCQTNVRNEVGDFCYDHCPFKWDFDCGQLCGEESPSAHGIPFFCNDGLHEPWTRQIPNHMEIASFCELPSHSDAKSSDKVLDDFGVWIKTEWVQESIKDYKAELREQKGA
jgi:hypothetical protein